MSRTKDGTIGVEVEHDGYAWVGIVDGGGTTQAKSLAKLRANVVEVVKLMRGSDISIDDVDLRISVPDAHVSPELVASLQALRSVSDQLAQLLTASTAAVAGSLKGAGLTVRDIGQVVGVSHQRIDQILGDDFARAAAAAQEAVDRLGPIDTSSLSGDLDVLTRPRPRNGRIRP